jgi:hypothetical protein
MKFALYICAVHLNFAVVPTRVVIAYLMQCGIKGSPDRGEDLVERLLGRLDCVAWLISSTS